MNQVLLHYNLCLMYMIVPILGSVRFFFLKQINTFIQQGRIKLIKSGSKYIYNAKKISIFKNCTSKLSFH